MTAFFFGKAFKKLLVVIYPNFLSLGFLLIIILIAESHNKTSGLLTTYPCCVENMGYGAPGELALVA